MKEDIAKRIEKINNGIVPEGYKKTKVGIVPVEWDRYKLSDISDELTEKAGNNIYETLSISAGIGFVNQANKFGKELSGKQYEKYIVLHKGDFSYNKGNSKKYPQGCIYQLKDRDEAAVPNVFESFRLNKGINDFYEQLFISGFLNCQLFAKINHGVRDDGLLNLKGEDFYSCYVPFPPLPEQQKIAEILSTQDKLIELQARKIEQLQTLKKGYLQKMFPKKGCKYPELRFKGFTDAWEQREFGNIANRMSETLLSSDKLPYIEYEDVISNQGILNKDVSTKEGVKTGIVFSEEDVLYGKLRPYLHNWLNPDFKGVAVGDWWVLKPINADKNFLYRLIQSENFDNVANQSTGTKMPRADWKLVSATEFCVPKSLEEQAEIGQYFTNLDNLITLHQRKFDEEKQKKKSLMQLLLTGKIRVKTNG